jgi:hypothetical protein
LVFSCNMPRISTICLAAGISVSTFPLKGLAISPIASRPACGTNHKVKKLFPARGRRDCSCSGIRTALFRSVYVSGGRPSVHVPRIDENVASCTVILCLPFSSSAHMAAPNWKKAWKGVPPASRADFRRHRTTLLIKQAPAAVLPLLRRSSVTSR